MTESNPLSGSLAPDPLTSDTSQDTSTTGNFVRRPVDEEMYRVLVDTVRDHAIFLLTPEGRVATWNAGAEAIKGYKADEIIGRHFSRFYPQDMIDRQRPQAELRLAAEHGRFEEENWRVRKDGSLFWASVVITALHEDGGKLRGFAKITRDLTERVRYEEQLRSSEERLRLLIDGATDHAIFMLDPEGRITSWNSGAQRLKGYQRDEIIGQHFSKFYLPEAIERGWPQHELRVAGEIGRFEDIGWRLRKDGSRFWANVVITAVYDANKRLRGFTKVTRDLTERNRVASIQELEKHMNEFLATLGHELRNPLGAIANASAIIKKVNHEGPMQGAAKILDRQVKQMGRLVDDLLDVARIRQGKLALRLQQLELKPVILHALEDVPLIAHKQHHLTVKIADDPMPVMGDKERLTQVFMNVLNNAAKYTPDGGRISVIAERQDKEAVVRIRDTGFGIESDLLPNVFDLFRQGERTLHNAHGGLGIGLTLVQRILQLHDGSIEAYSAGTNQGSEFVIRIPLNGASKSQEN